MKKKRPMPDDLVVGAEPEVPADALRLLLPERRRVAAQPGERVVGEAEADQEARDAEEIAEEDGDVVLVDVGEVAQAGRVQVMADVPAGVVAADAEEHGSERVEADQASTEGRAGGGRVIAHWSPSCSGKDRPAARCVRQVTVVPATSQFQAPPN